MAARPAVWLHPLTHWIILGFAMLATVLAWVVSAASIDRYQQSLFLQQSGQIAEAVEQRMLAYDTVLRGAAEHFRSHGQLSKDGWHNYVASLNLEQAYPGIQGIGYSRIVVSGAKSPVTDEDLVASSTVILLEPENAMNRLAIGFNQFAEATRHDAMLRAIDTAQPVVSGRVRLAVENSDEPQHGFLTFFPVYRGSVANASIAERRAAIRGFVFGVFRVGDLMRGIVSDRSEALHFEVFDGHVASANAFLFDSGSNSLLPKDDFEQHPLRRELALNIANRPWLLRVHATAHFFDPIQAAIPGAVGAAGLLINLILFFALRSITRSQTQLSASLDERDSMIAKLRTAESEVQAREETLRQLMDSLPASVALIDGNGDILQVNRSWSRFGSDNGADEALCNGTNINYFSTLSRAADSGSASAQASIQGFKQLSAGEIESFVQEYPCHAPNRQRWFQMTVTRMRDAVGHYVVTHTDISGVKEASERISRYADLTNGSLNPAFLIDRSGKVLIANHAADALLLSGTADGLIRSVHQVLAAVLAGESFKQTIIASEANATKKRYQMLAVPHSEDGLITAAVAVFTDITELHAAHERLEVHQMHLEHLVNARTAELLSSESRLRMILEATAEGIICTDARGVVEFANTAAEELLGYPRQGLVGRELHSTIHHHNTDGSLYHAAECPIHAMLAEGADVSAEEDGFWRQDGTRLPVRFASRKILADGEISGLVVAFSSNEERIAADHAKELALGEARKLAKSKSDFLSNMSHEIRTPLNAVIASAMLMERDETLPKQRERLQRIVGSSQHLLRLINDILDFSKLESGKVLLDSIEFKLQNIVDGVRNQVIEQLQYKGVAWRSEIDRELNGMLRGDPLRLGQVLLNLAANASKFTEHGEITLTARRVSETDQQVRVRFEIRDTGCGFDPEQAALLFQSFVQADSSTTRQYGGTGLGLAISQQIINLMDGEIAAESTPGIGSCFWFEVPLLRGTTINLHSPRRKVLLRGKRAMLLVADEAVASRLSDQLLLLGVGIQHAASTSELILRLETATRIGRGYDFIFCDETAEMQAIFCDPGVQRRIANPAQGKPAQRILFCNESIATASVAITPDNFDTRIHSEFDGNELQQLLTECLSNDDAPSEAAPTWSSSVKQLIDLQAYRLLLVEDNLINQQVAMDMLTSAGLTADVAHNGREACVLCDNRHYDLILMDMQMPIMGGVEATQAIRALPEYGSVPIIALTANASESDRQNCLIAGMSDYLSKPVEPDALYAMLRRWLSPVSKQTTTIATTTSIQVVQTIEQALPSHDQLPEIDGINIKVGLSRLSGRVSAYRRLLEQLIEMHGRDNELIGEKLQLKDAETARRLAHSLKGSSAMLAADAISAAALAVERGIDEGIDEQAMKSRLEDLANALAKLRIGLGR